MKLHHAAVLLTLVGCSSPDSPPDGSTGTDGSGQTDASDAGTVGDGSDGAIDPVTTDCVNKINTYRAKVLAPPVTSKSVQIACAVNQATKGASDLADSGTTTFHKYFGQCSEKYQNECWYSVNDPAAVIDWCFAAFWAEGPPEAGINHYSVMSDPKSTEVACGLYPMPNGGYWMTNDYY